MGSSQNNADEPAGALVEDFLQGLLHFLPGVLGHVLELGAQILADELVEGPAEDVGLPDFAGVALKLLEQVVHHVLGLLLVAHDGRYRSLDIRTDHVHCLVQTEVIPRFLWTRYSCFSPIAFKYT